MFDNCIIHRGPHRASHAWGERRHKSPVYLAEWYKPLRPCCRTRVQRCTRFSTFCKFFRNFFHQNELFLKVLIYWHSVELCSHINDWMTIKQRYKPHFDVQNSTTYISRWDGAAVSVPLKFFRIKFNKTFGISQSALPKKPNLSVLLLMCIFNEIFCLFLGKAGLVHIFGNLPANPPTIQQDPQVILGNLLTRTLIEH